MEPVLVSSCLLGLATRYDARSSDCGPVAAYLQAHKLLAVPVCPEQLAGLPTPRPKCWFAAGTGETLLQGQGQVQNEFGEDVSTTFLHGAEQSLKLALLTGCRRAILKQRSPSCGTRKVYLHDQLVDGMGVTAALLKMNGVQVFGEDQMPVESA